jgi:very-short-patch-repair endonuclease
LDKAAQPKDKPMKERMNRWRISPALWEKLRPLAREKRHKPTPAEKELWQHLKNRQLPGFIFRRQHSIGQFIVDFYCYKARLVIEIDGEIHQYKPEEDKIRQGYLENLELKVLRFSNDAVLRHTDEVVLQISNYMSTTI